MIVARVSDPLLMQAVRIAAHREEDVVWDEELVAEALQLGLPRLLVHSGHALHEPAPRGLSTVDLDDGLLRRWESGRRAAELPAPKLEYYADRLRVLLARNVAEATWVDRTLAEIGRAAGAPLPVSFRMFARRVLEFPSRYRTLRDLSHVCDLTSGALKARFRRRGLPSPYTYLRWLRLLAVGEALSDHSVTVARAARRLGFTSAGNLCRVTDQLTGATTTELRTPRGRRRLVVLFVSSLLTPDALAGWEALAELFERRVA